VVRRVGMWEEWRTLAMQRSLWGPSASRSAIRSGERATINCLYICQSVGTLKPQAVYKNTQQGLRTKIGETKSPFTRVCPHTYSTCSSSSSKAGHEQEDILEGGQQPRHGCRGHDHRRKFVRCWSAKSCL
jgi:hypothetical protein